MSTTSDQDPDAEREGERERERRFYSSVNQPGCADAPGLSVSWSKPSVLRLSTHLQFCRDAFDPVYSAAEMRFGIQLVHICLHTIYNKRRRWYAMPGFCP